LVFAIGNGVDVEKVASTDWGLRVKPAMTGGVKLLMISWLSVILNEVKNRIVTKGKPTAKILHFVQNVPMKFNQCVCFACGTNDMIGKADFFSSHFSPV